jgi:NAD(P)-dependent dehydrogenase (short-subunit alcohol dehydrogenase family)
LIAKEEYMAGILQNKVALVTGAGSGLGRKSAIVFAREGAKVVIADIDPETAKETVQMIKKNRGEASSIKVDISKEVEVESLIKEIITEYGQINCAFNNAGIELAPTPIYDINEQDWSRIINVNLKGTWLCLKHEIKQMKKQGIGGSIVNTSSVCGVVGGPNITPYTASKHGIIGLTRAAAIECAELNIRVNVICPAGMKDTGFFDNMQKKFPEFAKAGLERIPLKREAEVQEVAEVVVWLISDKASYATGSVFNIDGGLTAQ